MYMYMTIIFFSETARLIKANVFMEPPWGVNHMAKIAVIPIYGKNIKHFLLQNQKSHGLETWHAAKLYKVYIDNEAGLTMIFL